MIHLQPIYTELKQKLRDAISTVTLLPLTSSLKVFWGAHNTAAKIYEKDPKTLLEVSKQVEMFKAAQQVTATLTCFKST